MLRRLVALATFTAVVSTGCASRAWPSAGSSVTDPTFASRDRGVVTVDVLPLDLAVWTETGVTASPAELRARAEARIMNTALDALARGAYGVDAMIGWNGEASGMIVLPRADLIATATALAGYGAAVEHQPGTLPAPPLPVKLGQATGSDATLYVGGWAYVAAPRQSTGSKVAEGIAIAIVAVAVIGIVIAIAVAAKDSSSSSSKKSGGGAKSRGGATIRDHRAEPGFANRDHRGKSPWTRDHRRRDPGSTIRDHRAGTTPSVRDHRATQAPRGRANVAVDLSWMSEGDTEVDFGPSWRAQSPRPDLDKDSRLYLEMTLIDNRTGLVLWHTHQAFPANAAKPGEVERAARVLLSSLPAR